MYEQKSIQKVQEEKENASLSSVDYNKLVHDLRNLLSPMLIHSQMLEFHAGTAGSDTDEIKKSAAAIEEGIKAMIALLDNK